MPRHVIPADNLRESFPYIFTRQERDAGWENREEEMMMPPK